MCGMVVKDSHGLEHDTAAVSPELHFELMLSSVHPAVKASADVVGFLAQET